MNNDTPKNPWQNSDEGSHYPITREWWTFETIFETIADKRKWNLMLIMSYNLEAPSCFFQYTLFDISSKKCILREDIDDDVEKFVHKKNKLDLQYKQNKAIGLYPNYFLHLENKEKKFLIDMDFHAISQPHWIAQDITDGELPFGLNFYKYGYIPNTDIKGKMMIDSEELDLVGKGYIEHVWGDWSYQKPLSKIVNIKKTINTYANLGKWWLSHHKPKIPKTIAFTTENNIFGYDWAWGIFDNNWSLFYGNILFWLCQGPAFGVLSLTPDGKTYWDFSDISYKYNKVHYVKDYDVYFASDFEVDARLKDKHVHLRFYLNTNCYDYIDPFKKEGFYKAFILSEMPGKIIGKYTDSEKTISLQGDCKLMPLRQPSALGHNSLRIDITKPPKGVGFDIDFNSHFLKKKMHAHLHFAPRPRLQFNMKKIKKEDFTF